MNLSGVLIAALVVGITGLIIGLLLVMAAKKFKVEVDEKEIAVRELLPGNNCGGCGFAGCDALAKAIAEGTAAPNACPVGGASIAEQISGVLGVSVEETEKQIAYVKCAGTCGVAKEKYIYTGLKDCRDAVVVPGKGPKKCSYGCMGFGSCVTVCQFDAIHVIDGVAVVDKDKCVACGKCIETCPNQLIELVPYSAKYAVQCNSQDKGKTLKENCSAGCLGCTLCVKQCPNEAISMNGSVAAIDYSKCSGCGLCVEKCPAKIIRIKDQKPVVRKKPVEKAESKKQEAKKAESKKQESQRPENQRQESQRPENQRQESQRPENQRQESQRPENQRQESQRPENQRQESQRPENQRQESQRPENQRQESQRPENQRQESQRPENQRQESQRPESKKPGSQRPEVRKSSLARSANAVKRSEADRKKADK